MSSTRRGGESLRNVTAAVLTVAGLVVADFVRCIIRNVAQKLAKSVHVTYWSPGELWEVADGFQVSRVSGGVAVVAFG